MLPIDEDIRRLRLLLGTDVIPLPVMEEYGDTQSLYHRQATGQMTLEMLIGIVRRVEGKAPDTPRKDGQVDWHVVQPDTQIEATWGKGTRSGRFISVEKDGRVKVHLGQDLQPRYMDPAKLRIAGDTGA